MLAHQMRPCQTQWVRTTLDIDDTVMHALKELARREGRTAGAVASDLIRRALTQPQGLQVSEPPAPHGFVPFPSGLTDEPVTNEQVNRIREDLGI